MKKIFLVFFVSWFIELVANGAAPKIAEVWIDPTQGCSDSMKLYRFAKRLEAKSGGKISVQMKFFPTDTFDAPDGPLPKTFLFDVALRCVDVHQKSKFDPFYRAIYDKCGYNFKDNTYKDPAKVMKCLLNKGKKVNLNGEKLQSCLAPAAEISQGGRAPLNWDNLSVEVKSVLEELRDSQKMGGKSCRFLVVGDKLYNFLLSTQPVLEAEFATVEKEVLSSR